MRVMPIVKSKTSGNYLPLNDVDLPLFRHLCEGMIEVKDIAFYAPVFEIHDVAYWIADNEASMNKQEAEANTRCKAKYNGMKGKV